MYSKGKYVVGEIRTEFGTSMTAVCFNEVVPHSTFKPLFEEILGAGFFGLSDQGEIHVHVYGKSVSLGVESRPQDELQIRRALGLVSEYD